LVSRSAVRPARADAPRLAPYWHTAALVFVIVAVAMTGTWLQATGAMGAHVEAVPRQADSRILKQYAPLLVVNWALLAYVARLFRTNNALPELLGNQRPGARQLAIDLALASAGFGGIELFQALTVHASAAGRNAALSPLLPSTEAERLTWLVVALSVGFCEEVVYRGYLQTQLSAFAGRASFGIVLSAILFGMAHAEQGFASAVRIAGYGLALGTLAHFRRSLRPGILCHVAIDLSIALWR